MADDKTKRGASDRKKVAVEEPYEVAYFAKKHGLSKDDAERIIKRHGPERDACDKAANRLK